MRRSSSRSAGSRLDPELADERPTRLAVLLERFDLAAAAVQRDHQLPAQTLAIRVMGHEPLELAQHVGMSSDREIGIDAVLERGNSQLREAGDLGLREPDVAQVGEWLAAPETECLTQVASALLGIEPSTRLFEPHLEAIGVELAGLDSQRVAGRGSLDAISAQHAAQPRHVAVQRGHRGRRRRLAPQRVDQQVPPDDLVRAQQQVPEQSALSAALDRARTAILLHLQRA